MRQYVSVCRLRLRFEAMSKKKYPIRRQVLQQSLPIWPQDFHL
jgi:hypothetical protein